MAYLTFTTPARPLRLAQAVDLVKQDKKQYTGRQAPIDGDGRPVQLQHRTRSFIHATSQSPTFMIEQSGWQMKARGVSMLLQYERGGEAGFSELRGPVHVALPQV